MGTQNQIVDPLDRHDETSLVIIINSCKSGGNIVLLARAESALARKSLSIKPGQNHAKIQKPRQPENYYLASQGRA